ncbi:ubiquitin carboxyl-terminal hydrolase 12-like [Stylonychia lemnae]|uniref:Ubiquitin carboxyl-terminal hydrolase 12-like n=1 Tax=Stylonychia lemnae TaxID=5949 RepID=A0A078A5R1_STYLE|nr:ubiquitin carboxyl-terminal hydrolase 12-like [Stylonychia lemnae]|eukprot:CDW77585.1 ubiquitin carboxyl-terminal hydrolase 12-like [Stylonychia lemnae]
MSKQQDQKMENNLKSTQLHSQTSKNPNAKLSQKSNQNSRNGDHKNNSDQNNDNNISANVDSNQRKKRKHQEISSNQLSSDNKETIINTELNQAKLEQQYLRPDQLYGNDMQQLSQNSKRRKINGDKDEEIKNNGQVRKKGGNISPQFLELNNSKQKVKRKIVEKKEALNVLQIINSVISDPQIDQITDNNFSQHWRQRHILLDDKKINKEDILYSMEESDRYLKDAIELEDFIYANSILFQRNQPDGHSRILWALINLENCLDSNKPVYSAQFTLPDLSSWFLSYNPKVINEDNEIGGQITIHAIENQQEISQGFMKRALKFTFSSFTRADGGPNSLKSWSCYYQFTQDNNKYTIYKFFHSKIENRYRAGFNRLLNFGIYLESVPYIEDEPIQPSQSNHASRRKSSQGKNYQQQKVYNGLINEGTTCYLNSLIQTLYIIRAFRKAVYHMPTNIEDFKSIPFCLQRIFYNLQTGKEAVRTFELLNAFGWSVREMNQQHDVNEFFLVLSDTLEQQMRDTPVNGTYSNLFEGITENVIECMNVDYESTRKDTFNCLQLSMTDCETIEQSILKYVEAEELTGDNQYDAEKFGKQDARKYIRFRKLPPVLQIQVNRFTYDIEQDQMAKINAQLRFHETLDLDSLLPKEVNMSQFAYSQIASDQEVKNLYHLHSILIHRGTLGAGHYYAFIRPSLDDKWFEFNDSKVEPILQSTALSIGSGGNESVFEFKDGSIYERQRSNNTSAYMLVYIRDCDREEIMAEIPIDQIPAHLKERFDEENQLNRKLDHDQELMQECGNVFITSLDIIKNWREGGIQQVLDDIYQCHRLKENEEQRLKIQIKRKSKYIDLVTELRKNLKYSSKDISMYKLKQRKDKSYSFIHISEDRFNEDIFGKNGYDAYFFICNNKDLNAPILQRYTEQEIEIRNRKYQNLIDFVIRRDLNQQYKDNYESKMIELWKFSGSREDSNDSSEDYEIGQDEIEDIIMNDQDQTLDIPPDQNADNTQQNLLTMATQQIAGNQQDSNQSSKANKQDADEFLYQNQQNNQARDMTERLIFIKTFNDEGGDYGLTVEGAIIAHSFLDHDMLKEKILQSFPYLGQDQDMFLELPTQFQKESNLALEEPKLKCIILSQSRFFVRDFVDGTIIILGNNKNQNIAGEISSFLDFKNNEIWVQLIQKEGDSTLRDMGKVQMSYNLTPSDVYDAIREQISCQFNEEVEDGYIQLHLGNGNKLQFAEEKDFSQLLVEGNQIHFEQLQFKLEELLGNIVVKVHFYNSRNEYKLQFVKLFQEKINVWQVVKMLSQEIKAEFNEEVVTRQYMFSFIDKNSKTIIRALDFKDLMSNLIEEAQRKNYEFRISAIQPEELLMMEEKQIYTGFLYCTIVDQQNRVIHNPFITVIPKNLPKDQVREAIISKLLTYNVTYNHRRSRDQQDEQEVSEITKGDADISYIEYRSLRRVILYNSFTLRDIPKDSFYLDFQKLNQLHIAVEIQLLYEEDDHVYRGNQLKIYDRKNSNENLNSNNIKN